MLEVLWPFGCLEMKLCLGVETPLRSTYHDCTMRCRTPSRRLSCTHTCVNGRGTPLLDDGHLSESLRSQLIDMQQQAQCVISENKDLRLRIESLEKDLGTMRNSEIASLRHSVRQTNVYHMSKSWNSDVGGPRLAACLAAVWSTS